MWITWSSARVGTPDSILLKPGKLSEEEWVMMRRHPAMGAEIIGRHDNDLLRTAHTIALNHHEKWDGSGYPAGLSGEEIPLPGRIVAVADVLDALLSARPYKPVYALENAMEFMKPRLGNTSIRL